VSLKTQGWVDSFPGVHGGYFLAKQPSQITMGEILRHFDGIMAPIDCVSVNGYQRCSQESVCRFRRVFLDARNYVANLMDRATLAEVPITSDNSLKELEVACRDIQRHGNSVVAEQAEESLAVLKLLRPS
jgi:DNA-binding IscR family transcriptional regulator